MTTAEELNLMVTTHDFMAQKVVRVVTHFGMNMAAGMRGLLAGPWMNPTDGLTHSGQSADVF